VLETTALGAAYLAGLAVGVWDIDQIAAQWQVERIFEPIMARAEADERMQRWRTAVNRIVVDAKPEIERQFI